MTNWYPAKPTLVLDTRRVVMALALLTAVAAAAQLALGASPAVLMLALLIIIAGLFAFATLGAFNTGAWLALFYVLGNVVIALYAKTVFGQPVDSHLHAPVASFVVLAASTGALVAALAITRRIAVGRPLFSRTTDTRTLAWLTWGSFVLGCSSWFLNQHFLGPSGSGFGGLAVFNDLLLMAVIGRTALVLERTSYRRSVDLVLAIMICAAIVLGLLSDTKTSAAYPVVAYFATLIFYRRGLSRRQAAFMTVAGTVFVIVVAPLVHVWRGQGLQHLGVRARVQLVAQSIQDVANDAPRVSDFQAVVESGFRGGYYDYFGSNGRGQMLLGRYASVQQIDPVIAQAGSQGTMGSTVISAALMRLLPSFLYPNKPQPSEAYSVLVHFGLIEPSAGKYPTLPLAGQAFAAYGLPGVISISFIVFLGVLLSLKKYGWDLYQNPFAVFIFSEFIVVYAAQGDLAQYVGLVVRAMPVYFAVFWLLLQGPRLRIRRANPSAVSRRPTNSIKNAHS